jgi:hypothetical protein
MVYEELKRRPDEVFEYRGDELLRVFPRLKRSALSWSLWLLAKAKHIGKMRVRVDGRLTTIYGSHEAIRALKARLQPASEETGHADDERDDEVVEEAS